MTTPIRPDQLIAAKAAALPAYVFEAINELLTRKLRFTVDEAAAAILIKATEEISREGLFDAHYLDFEDAYRAAGWIVVFNQPAYNETYAANYTFKKPRKS